jgi:PPM family protein phosphatase
MASVPSSERASSDPPDRPGSAAVEGVRVDAAYLADIGRARSENQDACGAFCDAAGNRLFVVADGMGGHRGGATASRICVQTLGRAFEASGDALGRRLHDGIAEAGDAIQAAAEEDPGLGDMGTTAVALALGRDGEAWVAWVGDSRAYRLRAGTIERLTEDHSIVAEMVRRSLIRPEEAASHPRRSELLRCIGPSSQLEIDLQRVDVADGDRFLLCTDGLWGQVGDAEIAAVAGVETPERAVARLVELANLRGGPDNITVQIAALSGAAAVPLQAPLPAAPAPSAPVEPARASWLPMALVGSAVAVAAVLVLLLWFASTHAGG